MWQRKTMTRSLCTAYLANSEVQKSGVSTNRKKKQTAFGQLFKESISDQTQQSTLNDAEQAQPQNVNSSDRILQVVLT